MERYIGQQVKLDQDVKIEGMTNKIDVIPKGTSVTLIKKGFLWRGKIVLCEHTQADSLDSGTLAKYITDNCRHFEKDTYEDDEDEYIRMEDVETKYFLESLEELLSDLFITN